MNATATKHRDPLDTVAALSDMAARLHNLPPSASLEHRIDVLDSIFHDLAAMAVRDGKLCHRTTEMALSVQRLCLRLYKLWAKQEVKKLREKLQNELRDRKKPNNHNGLRNQSPLPHGEKERTPITETMENPAPQCYKQAVRI